MRNFLGFYFSVREMGCAYEQQGLMERLELDALGGEFLMVYANGSIYQVLVGAAVNCWGTWSDGSPSRRAIRSWELLWSLIRHFAEHPRFVHKESLSLE